jgi:hypothetical protein
MILHYGNFLNSLIIERAMPIVGSNLTEFKLTRNEFPPEKKIKLGKVKSDVKVIDIKQQDVMIPGIQKSLVFSFEFSVDYGLEEPKKSKLGEIVVRGNILFVVEVEKQNKIVREWKKSKKIDGEILKEVISAALEISQIEALYFARKVMLPSPIPLPRVKFADGNQNYIG